VSEPGLLRKKLVVEHDVEKRTVDLQCIASVIIDEPQFPEPVHEKVNPRASRAHHLCERFLTDFRNQNFGLTFLAEMRQQQQHSGESLFTRIEKLIDYATNMSENACSR
jgi:hypothetical protein